MIYTVKGKKQAQAPGGKRKVARTNKQEATITQVRQTFSAGKQKVKVIPLDDLDSRFD